MLMIHVPSVNSRFVGRGRLSISHSGYDIRTVQELLGHATVSTTMIYTHVLKVGGGGARSPLDLPVFEAARHAPSAHMH